MLVITFVSCRGGSDVRDKLIGKWRPIKSVEDFNGNGRIDPNDLYKDPPLDDFFVTFNANGTVIVIYMNDTSEQTWSLERNNTYLKMISTSGGNAGMIYEHIDSLTSTSIILKDTSGDLIRWNIWRKQ